MRWGRMCCPTVFSAVPTATTHSASVRCGHPKIGRTSVKVPVCQLLPLGPTHMLNCCAGDPMEIEPCQKDPPCSSVKPSD